MKSGKVVKLEEYKERKRLEQLYIETLTDSYIVESRRQECLDLIIAQLVKFGSCENELHERLREEAQESVLSA